MPAVWRNVAGELRKAALPAVRVHANASLSVTAIVLLRAAGARVRARVERTEDL